MKYSLDCLTNAINMILPELENISGSSMGMSRTTKMDMAAKRVFMYPQRYCMIHYRVAKRVIQVALCEISETGSLIFGDVNEPILLSVFKNSSKV